MHLDNDSWMHTESLETDFEDMAMVGLDAMQRANSTLEDFVSSCSLLPIGLRANEEILAYRSLHS